jgi:hypothetical protein
MSYFDSLPSELIEILSEYLSLDNVDKFLGVYRPKVLQDEFTWSRILSSGYPDLYPMLKELNMDTLDNCKTLYYSYKDNSHLVKTFLISYDPDDWWKYTRDNFIMDNQFICHLYFYKNWKYVYNRLRDIDVIYKLGRFTFSVSLNLLTETNSWNSILAQLGRLNEIRDYLNEHNYQSVSKDTLFKLSVDKQSPLLLYLYLTDPGTDKNINHLGILNVYFGINQVTYDLSLGDKDKYVNLLYKYLKNDTQQNINDLKDTLGIDDGLTNRELYLNIISTFIDLTRQTR